MKKYMEVADGTLYPLGKGRAYSRDAVQGREEPFKVFPLEVGGPEPAGELVAKIFSTEAVETNEQTGQSAVLKGFIMGLHNELSDQQLSLLEVAVKAARYERKLQSGIDNGSILE